MRVYLFIILVIITVAFWGCSKSDSNPVFIDSFHNSLPASVSAQTDSLGLFGIYELIIHPDKFTAELTPLRSSSIGESYLVSGLSFFTIAPCVDCLGLSSISFDDPYIKLTFNISHPFDPGNVSDPPSAVNRRDLDVFDLAVVVKPTGSYAPILIPGTEEYISYGAIGEQDGYTTELNTLIGGDSNALPYILVVDETEMDPIPSPTTWNRFAMGDETTFSIPFALSPGEQLSFDLYLTMGYGFSAVKADRLQPKYYNPEFNRKAAWKVNVIPPEGDYPPDPTNTWTSTDDLTERSITVEVYDWQQVAAVYLGSDYAIAPENEIYKQSIVKSITVQIIGMNPDWIGIDDPLGTGTGLPGAPLIYEIPLRNENLAPAGEYVGWININDSLTGGDPHSADRGYLIHSTDGINMEFWHPGSFMTYQTFIATVVEEPE